MSHNGFSNGAIRLMLEDELVLKEAGFTTTSTYSGIYADEERGFYFTGSACSTYPSGVTFKTLTKVNDKYENAGDIIFIPFNDKYIENIKRWLATHGYSVDGMIRKRKLMALLA